MEEQVRKTADDARDAEVRNNNEKKVRFWSFHTSLELHMINFGGVSDRHVNGAMEL
jgi:hypothetical protein